MQLNANSMRWLRCFAVSVFTVSVTMLATFSIRAEDPDASLTFPRTILIIRHGEKPPEGDASVHLSTQGEQRAAALHELFERSEKRPKPFPVPDDVFATAASRHSKRPIETVKPLVNLLRIPFNKEHADDDFQIVANEIFHNKKYEGKTILICWHHGKIPELARALKVVDAPSKWNDLLFDRIWRITYDATGKATFTDLPQRLLPTDTKE
jgi:hypothetical protein